MLNYIQSLTPRHSKTLDAEAFVFSTRSFTTWVSNENSNLDVRFASC